MTDDDNWNHKKLAEEKRRRQEFYANNIKALAAHSNTVRGSRYGPIRTSSIQLVRLGTIEKTARGDILVSICKSTNSKFLTADIGVKITHMPTMIDAVSTNHKTLYLNKKAALEELENKLNAAHYEPKK